MPADPNSAAAEAALKAAGWTREQYNQYVAQKQAPTSGFGSLSDEDLMGLLGGGSGAPAEPYGSPINFGGSLYSYNQQTGKLEKLIDGGAGGGGGSTYHPPAPESMIDPRTGELILIDHTGAVSRTGQIIGYGDIDPREKFAAEENQRGFSNSMATYNSQLAARQQAIDQFESAQNRLISVAGQKEQGRQADLRAAVDQWQTAMNLIPQMGQLAIQESERVQGILQNGGDFLARAFESRGGTSPLAKVTQADQINAIGQSLSNLRGMINANSGNGPASSGGYQAPDLGAGGPAGGFGEPPAAPTYKPYELPAAPTVAPPSGPAPADYSGGGGGFAAAPAPGGYNPATDLDPWESPLGPTLAPPANHDPARMSDRAANASAAPASQISAPGAAYDWSNEPNPDAAERGDPGAYDTNTLNRAGGAGYGFPSIDWGGIFRPTEASRYKDGTPSNGYTTEPVFIGNEEGPELFENPTGAPIRIHDAEATQKMVPGYDEGTDGGYDIRTMHRFGPRMEEFMGGQHPDFGAIAAGLFSPRGFGNAIPEAQAAAQAARPLMGRASGSLGTLVNREPQLNQWGGPMGEQLARPTRLRGFATGTNFDPGAYFNDTNYGKGFDATKAIGGFTRAAANNSWAAGGGGQLNALPGGGTTTSALTGMQPGQSYGSYYQQYGGRDQFGHQLDNPTDVARNAHWNTPEALAARRGEAPVVSGYKPVSQKELIALAKSTAPPAVTSVLAGGLPPAREQLKSQDPDSTETLPILTARQLSAMTPEEIKALGTTTNTIFNAPLDYVTGQTMANYGQKDGTQRGFLRGAGL